MEHIEVDLGNGARGLFTTRHGGVSEAPFDTLNLGRWTDDDQEAVEENRGRVLALTGCGSFQYGKQVHGTRVLRDADGVEEAAVYMLAAGHTGNL